MNHINPLPLPDVFDWHLAQTNHNWFASGAASESKLAWTQAMALQVLNEGGGVCLKAMGDSHKAFCGRIGGVYQNARSLTFNPFANITKESFSMMADSVCDLLCVMACPNGQLDELLEVLLLDAVTELWPRYQQDMRIDHVIDFLKARQREMRLNSSSLIAERIDCIITQLHKYATQGLYGAYFNSAEPTLAMSESLVVVDMLDLHEQGELLAVGLCTTMLRRESLMYDKPRSQRKMDITDGCWEQQHCASDRLGVFIEKRYRMARHFNASCGTVSTSLRDKNRNPALLSAFNNSAFKFTLMQALDALTLFRNEEPETFDSLEWMFVETLSKLNHTDTIAFLLKNGNYSHLHRLQYDCITSMDNELSEVKDIKGHAR